MREVANRNRDNDRSGFVEGVEWEAVGKGRRYENNYNDDDDYGGGGDDYYRQAKHSPSSSFLSTSSPSIDQSLLALPPAPSVPSLVIRTFPSPSLFTRVYRNPKLNIAFTKCNSDILNTAVVQVASVGAGGYDGGERGVEEGDRVVGVNGVDVR